MERRPDTTPYRGPYLLAMERLPVSLLAEADIFCRKFLPGAQAMRRLQGRHWCGTVARMAHGWRLGAR